MQRYRHIRSPPPSLHSSTLSLPLNFISSVHLYCHLHSFYESFVPVLASSHESAIGQWRRAPFSASYNLGTRHDTYIFNIKGSRCYYHHHQQQRHCHKHQLTAVSFVRTVLTVCVAATHIILGDAFPLWALPAGSGALPVGWTTNKVIAFRVTFTFTVTVFVSLHFRTLLSSHHSPFSSLSFIHHLHHVHSPWKSVFYSLIEFWGLFSCKTLSLQIWHGQFISRARACSKGK